MRATDWNIDNGRASGVLQVTAYQHVENGELLGRGLAVYAPQEQPIIVNGIEYGCRIGIRRTVDGERISGFLHGLNGEDDPWRYEYRTMHRTPGFADATQGAYAWGRDLEKKLALWAEHPDQALLWMRVEQEAWEYEHQTAKSKAVELAGDLESENDRADRAAFEAKEANHRVVRAEATLASFTADAEKRLEGGNA